MAGHFDKSFTARDPEMARYLVAAQSLAKDFLNITFQAIPWACNEAADEFAKIASSAQPPPPPTNINYRVAEEEPKDCAEAKRLQQHARNYVIINGLLYKGVCAPTALVHFKK